MANAETARLIASLELQDKFSSKLGGAERALGSFDKRLGQTESRAYKAGTQIGTGIKRVAAASVALAVAGGGVFIKALGAASDLNETVSKVGVVFGKQAGPVLAFGKTSAAALGLSENAAESAAATYGNLFVSMGFAQKKSADMSINLVKLAGDLASFNNIDPTEALEKLRAGLTGETEPLKSLGINMNEQTLKAKALELGLVKLKKGQTTYTAVLTPAVKAQAAYALIMEQSKTAQGDFARTSGGLANQIRILKANFTDMLATLAGPSLPKVAKIFQEINKQIKANQPAIAELGDSIAGLFSDENIKTGGEFLTNAFKTAKETAPIVAASAKATFGFVQAAVGAFKSLPPEIQKLAVGAFAVNKLTGGLVTNIAGGIIDTVGKQFLQRGGTPANPLFVSDVAGLAGKVAGGAGAAGGIGLATIAKTLLTTVAIPAVIGLLIAGKFAGVGPFASGKETNQITGVNAKIKQGPGPGDLNIRQLEAAENRTTHAVIAAQLASNAAFRKVVAGLKDARGAKDIAAAVKASLSKIFTEGKGGSGGAGNVLKALTAQLKNTHDPALQRTLRAAIDRVEKKIVSRKIVENQLKRADEIYKSSKSNVEKIKELKEVQKAIGNRNAIATKRVQDKIDAAKKADVAAQARTRQAIKEKRWQFTVKTQVNTDVHVDARQVGTAIGSFVNAFKFPP